MTKRMLIDATHAEETRVAVVDGQKLVDFDYESKVRKQLKGSIFLAKVTRVEPSLQAAFVNFGGNRHGFLPFSEIHPDYFRIPIADREALLAEQANEMKALEAEQEAEEQAAAAAAQDGEGEAAPVESNEAGALDEAAEEEEDDEVEEIGGEDVVAPLEGEEASAGAEEARHEEQSGFPAEENAEAFESSNAFPADAGDEQPFDGNSAGKSTDNPEGADDNIGNAAPAEGEGGRNGEGGRHGRHRGGRDRGRGRGRGRGGRHGGGRDRYAAANSRRVEMVGGDGIDGDHPVRPTMRRHYKIQEVVKRGQIMLVQVSKEERGNKGAAVTTYLSLPGRYCVLMPNSTRAGGVSRKIANYEERSRMREILAELSVPEGMSVIMRTAGMSRTKTEIKRDLDYLMKLWDNIRELTLQSTAPAIIHEEGNLIRRSIRDIYGRDIEDIQVSGDEGFKLARDFMKMMIPSHIKRVNHYEDKIPLFHKFGVENQIYAMGEPIVTLRSGGYIVINPTEALVSVDVNSGRATRERHIEETALKTNLEAAEEVARQLRLRDLGGLVVIDFIDMEDRRNNRRVEERLKQALSTDRARIQIGRISSFGLLELSRQRLNPSLTEAQFQKCDHCNGIGYVRTVNSAAITALRALEDEGIKGRSHEVILRVSNDVAVYMLNNKRLMIADLEKRYGFTVLIRVDDELPPSGFAVEAGKGGAAPSSAPPRQIGAPAPSYNDSEGGEESEAPADEGEESGEDRQPDSYQGRNHGDRDRPRREGGFRDGGPPREGGPRDGEGGRGGRGARRRGRRGGRRHNPNYQGGPGGQGGQGGGNYRDQQGGMPYDTQPQPFGGDDVISDEDDNRGNRINSSEAPPDRDGNRVGGGEGREGGGNRAGGRGGRRRGRGGRGRGGHDPDWNRPREGGGPSSGNERPYQGGGDSADAFASEPAPAPAADTRPNPAPERVSNDTQSPPPAPRPKDYERINEPAGEKKKGWWRRGE